MPLLIIRIHPTRPTTGTEFTDYLTDLKINAFDLSFANLDPGTQIGQAERDPDATQTTIIQHLDSSGQEQPVATAVVLITGGGPEFRTLDVRLELDRGSMTVPHPTLHYNVQLRSGSTVPARDPAVFANLQPVGIHLALPPSGVGVNPADPSVELPQDGSPPPFEDLLLAVQAVLAQDPTTPVDLAQLTRAQCLHIARELVWNRVAEPPPEPSRSLEELYRPTNDPFTNADRTRFEAELASYYATRDAEAEQLSRYIFSLSAALDAEAMSAQAPRVGFRFPIYPDDPNPTGRIHEAEVILEP